MLNLGFKATILVAVCLQNAGYTLLRKYSTMTEDVSSREILLVGEVIKVVVATYFTYNNSITRSEPSDARGTGLHRLWWLLANSWKMLVVALIYGAMNILSFVALQYIGAGEFTVCAQLKILSTASASVLILNRPLTATKWRALALLVLGCILVAYSTLDAHKDTGGAESVNQENSAGNTLPASPLNQIMPKDGNEWVYGQVLGYIAVITEVCLSGFASIYFEKVVKSTNEVITIWERNFQLGVFSMIMYGSIMTYDIMTTEHYKIGNWSFVTFSVSALGALGGLLVAATLKYADSILKTLAAAGAIVLSTVLGYILLDGPFTIITCIGALSTILSICNFTMDTTPPAIVTPSPHEMLSKEYMKVEQSDRDNSPGRETEELQRRSSKDRNEV